jgi:hypothetical protein
MMGLFFSYFFNAHVYATFIDLRIFPYVFLSHIIFIISLLDTKYSLRIDIKKYVNKISVNDVILTMIIITLILSLYPSFYKTMFIRYNSERSPLSDDGLKTFNWLNDNAESDSYVLINERTTGAFYVLSNCHSIFEGRAPYLEPDLLYVVLTRFNETNHFFENPNYEILDKYNISYVIVSLEKANFGGNLITKISVDVDKLNGLNFLEKREEFEKVIIYEVI